MRCNSCSKFVSYDDPQCDSPGDVEIDGDTLRVTHEIALNCADCGETLKTASIEAETSMGHTCPVDAVPALDWKDGDDQFEIDDEGDPEGTSRQQTIDRRGKPIKNPRYMRTFYGFTQDITVKCLRCGETFNVILEADEQASAFEEQ